MDSARCLLSTVSLHLACICSERAALGRGKSKTFATDTDAAEESKGRMATGSLPRAAGANGLFALEIKSANDSITTRDGAPGTRFDRVYPALPVM